MVNAVSASHLEVMSKSSHEVPREVDEFDYVNIAKAASRCVKPPRVAEAIVSYECKLNQIIDFGEGAISGHLVCGDVVTIHVQDHAIQEGKIDNETVDAIGRMSGPEYSLTREKTQLSRS